MERRGVYCPECGTGFGVWLDEDGSVETQGCSYVLVSGSHRPLTPDEILKQVEIDCGPRSGGYRLSPKSLSLKGTG